MFRFIRSVVVLGVSAQLLAAALLANDAFEVTSPGKPGSGGLVPALDGTGGLTPGSTNNTALLTDAAPNRSATLVLGLSQIAAGFKGGVLGPAPDKLVFGFGTDAAGALVLPVMPPAELPPGFAVFAQFWIDDPGASVGLSAAVQARSRSATSTSTAHSTLPS